jgi:hypothetical protein
MEVLGLSHAVWNTGAPSLATITSGIEETLEIVYTSLFLIKMHHMPLMVCVESSLYVHIY